MQPFHIRLEVSPPCNCNNFILDNIIGTFNPADVNENGMILVNHESCMYVIIKIRNLSFKPMSIIVVSPLHLHI